MVNRDLAETNYKVEWVESRHYATWTPEQDAALKYLWEHGHSSGEIAAYLKPDRPNITRNSVMGRLDRLKLTKKRGKCIKVVPPVKKTVIKTKPQKVNGAKLFKDLNRDDCRYCFGKYTDDPVWFCGEKIVKGVYCEEHYHLCFQKRREK